MKHLKIILTVLCVVLLFVPTAKATNGTNLIGIGPISRAMGGGGVAAPQDSISAIFANPAAICFGPFCPGSSVDIAATWFDPTVNGKFSGTVPGPFSLEGESELKPFVVPAVGLTAPINQRLRFGVGLFGVSGLGADYKGTQIAPPNTPDILYTQLQTLKFAPNVAYLITPDFSLGMSVEVVWQNLDLGEGSSHGYTLGAQIGALYHIGAFNIGASYITPEGVNHENVYDLDGDGTFDDLKIQSPQTFKFGVAYQPNTTWLIEANTRWYNWSSTDGYGDFDWEDQWVFAIGGQYRPIERLALRLGYNYGKTPVKDNSGFNPAGTVDVQGKAVNTLNYETLRVLGFPALAEQHFTGGVGINLTDNWILNLSLMYSPKNSLKETSAGDAITLEADLEEWSTTFGLTTYF
jgi:long-chain fatty acid transport protein